MVKVWQIIIKADNIYYIKESIAVEDLKNHQSQFGVLVDATLFCIFIKALHQFPFLQLTKGIGYLSGSVAGFPCDFGRHQESVSKGFKYLEPDCGNLDVADYLPHFLISDFFNHNIRFS